MIFGWKLILDRWWCLKVGGFGLFFFSAAGFEFFTGTAGAVVVATDFDGGSSFGKVEFELGFVGFDVAGYVCGYRHVVLSNLAGAGGIASEF